MSSFSAIYRPSLAGAGAGCWLAFRASLHNFNVINLLIWQNQEFTPLNLKTIKYLKRKLNSYKKLKQKTVEKHKMSSSFTKFSKNELKNTSITRLSDHT